MLRQVIDDLVCPLELEVRHRSSRVERSRASAFCPGFVASAMAFAFNPFTSDSNGKPVVCLQRGVVSEYRVAATNRSSVNCSGKLSARRRGAGQ
jgi:hypothetical protein